MTAFYQLGGFLGGGLVLGYRCSSRCRHCLYACGPHRRDGKPSFEELEQVLDLLAERAPQARYHIGGGEPFLDFPLLKHAVSGMSERGLSLDYIETNSSWVKSAEQAEQVLCELAALGLKSVLVSVSPFHAEFVPPFKTKTLIAAAQRALPHGPFVWIPEFLRDMTDWPQTERLDLGAQIDEHGDAYALGLGDRYGLIPGGRAGRFYFDHGRSRPWQELTNQAPCAARLRDTSHFHVDGQGRYVPGLCAGLVLPLEKLPGPLELEDYPIIAALLEPEGLDLLVRRARAMGFKPASTYSAACDLCTHARGYLFAHDPTPDLGPEGFYDARSLSGFCESQI